MSTSAPRDSLQTYTRVAVFDKHPTAIEFQWAIDAGA
jgi:hypothetical protein